ncbi:beta-glucuronidase [Glacieibacterium frigidum]|uniref:Beta-glucuronidase n=2 Tax=Glacieibacterium frigidum TaxID=2593303 RepID=A0A552UGJ0_9SPHN|nr:beta-glucuronidase [Glacieibacterium frigidum]
MDTHDALPTLRERVANNAVSRRSAFTLLGGAAVATSLPFVAPARAAQPGTRRASGGLLYPHESVTRTTREIGGVWRFRTDPSDIGEREGWENGLAQFRLIPVPASWNEIFDDVRNYTGTAWYETYLNVARSLKGQRIVLRFGSVQYAAKVWLNGKAVGGHVGGHLPFVIDITDAVLFDGPNRLTVQVENKLLLERSPAVPDTGRFAMTVTHYPQTTYDFFPFTGIHRPVLLCTMPEVCVDDITVVTTLSGRVTIDVATSTTWTGKAKVSAGGSTATIAIRDGRGSGSLSIANPRLWSPEDPHLYTLSVRLEDPALLDEYRMKIGVRTVAVDGDRLLLNGKPVFLRGFGKHEDFPVHGRGLDVASIVRDFELMKWLGANSFRTSHYPYSDEAMMLADELGFLVIDESSGVSLVFADPPATIEARRLRLEDEMRALVSRDKNHPCVILWSVANEPQTKPFNTHNVETPGAVEAGVRFFKSVIGLTRTLDPTRPVTLVGHDYGPDEWLELGDVICANKYGGWYYLVGQLDKARGALVGAINDIRKRMPGKPVIITEFGADAVAGMHAQPAEMWSEEYQSEMIEMYIEVAKTFPFIVGTHPWAFADFRTSQSVTRVGALNHKGVFTRDRRPKLAAHTLRRLWKTAGR